MPVALTEAIAALLVIHVPPEVPSVKVIFEPTQTDEGPAIEPAAGDGLTVNVVVVKADAHAVVTV